MKAHVEAIELEQGRPGHPIREAEARHVQRPPRRSSSKRAMVSRRPVWASTCHTTTRRARVGSASQSAMAEITRPASTTTATVSQRRRRVTSPVCLAGRPGAY